MHRQIHICRKVIKAYADVDALHICYYRNVFLINQVSVVYNCVVQDKLEKQHATTHRTVSELETKLAQAEAYRDAIQKYIQQIEQANDDLERAKR